MLGEAEIKTISTATLVTIPLGPAEKYPGFFNFLQKDLNDFDFLC